MKAQDQWELDKEICSELVILATLSTIYFMNKLFVGSFKPPQMQMRDTYSIEMHVFTAVVEEVSKSTCGEIAYSITSRW